MKNLTLSLDDEMDAALAAACAEQGRDPNDLVADALRQFLDKRELRRNIQRPEWLNLYRQMADEDVSLAEAGIADYSESLRLADKA